MRVLVVEDDSQLGAVLLRGLQDEGYAVDLEPTALTAQHAMSTNEYDLVLLDLGLPDADGLTVCHELRDRGLSMPVLVLTARDDLDTKVRGLDAGADDYMTKPFDFPELAARVRALLRRPAGDRSPRLEAGPLVLDPAAHVVTNDDVTIPLTAREFALLHLLMSRIDTVVSRTTLLEHVWDAHYDGMSNVVDVHIRNLRRKLGDGELIETVRGAGYLVRS